MLAWIESKQPRLMDDIKLSAKTEKEIKSLTATVPILAWVWESRNICFSKSVKFTRWNWKVLKLERKSEMKRYKYLGEKIWLMNTIWKKCTGKRI